jgi:iron complex outermembrane receptor protein
MKTFSKLFLSILIFLHCSAVRSQEDSLSNDALDGMSLKDLLNMKIVSASGSPELWMDAPLSSSIVTKEEIRRANCTTIMEALRLVPGVIVREQTNGNYDVYIRGMDNIPPNSSFDVVATTTLVMIDNRPIYSYLRGGTFWETLPVDLNDVDRIEVVRGPAGALYGPNAINGVINIITRNLVKKGAYAVANSQAGSNKTIITNGSVGYKGDKWSAILSGNYQHRDRSQTSYFEYWSNREIENPSYFVDLGADTVTNLSVRYPDRSLAMKKSAGNVFFNYDPGTDVKLSFKAGLQESLVQKVSAENESTPLSTASSNSHYFELNAQIKGFKTELSHNSGVQNIDFSPGNKYKFSATQGNIEYNWTRKNLIIRPAMSYRKAVYDDRRYSDTAHHAGIFNAKGTLTTYSAFLRAEYKMLHDRLRLVSGFGASKFNLPDTTYVSYEFAATYKPSSSHLFRMVYSMTPRSSNIFDTYVNQDLTIFPIGYQNYLSLKLQGNKNLKLFTAKMFEVGYRTLLGKGWNLDIEIFDIKGRNENALLSTIPTVEMHGADTILVMPLIATNLPMRVNQQGITLTVNYTARTLQIKTHATIQQTKLKDYKDFDYSILPGQPVDLNQFKGFVTKHRSTPSLFGGATINYLLTPRFNMNLAAYYTAAFTYSHLTKTVFNDGVRGIDAIDSKILLNLTLSYEAVKGLHIFCSGKNLLNENAREFYYTDRVPVRFMAGFNFELKK